MQYVRTYYRGFKLCSFAIGHIAQVLFALMKRPYHSVTYTSNLFYYKICVHAYVCVRVFGLYFWSVIPVNLVAFYFYFRFFVFTKILFKIFYNLH